VTTHCNTFVVSTANLRDLQENRVPVFQRANAIRPPDGDPAPVARSE
jgi:hypothetical protein